MVVKAVNDAETTPKTRGSDTSVAYGTSQPSPDPTGAPAMNAWRNGTTHAIRIAHHSLRSRRHPDR